jgi:hypothetical protein
LLLCFAIALEIFQVPIHYRWSQNEDVYSRNVTYKDEEEGTLDVLYFGTSEIYNDVFPTAMYEEAGITGMNFAVSHKSAITTYYQAKYALKYQTPKIVCCDFSALFADKLPSYGESNELIYRKIVDTMPDLDIKLELIASMKLSDKHLDTLSYLFPIFRYHSKWSELTETDFQKDYQVSDSYQIYSMGCRLQEANVYDEQVRTDITVDTEITPEFWNVDTLTADEDEDGSQTTLYGEEEPAKYSEKYYDKLIELCQEKGIQVVALIPPVVRNGALKTARMAAMKEYLTSRGVDIIDYNTYEEVSRLGLNFHEHYSDAAHLNYKGALILSKDLADVLSKNYDLTDHRGDAAYAKWDTYWQEFSETYDVQ